MTRSSTMCPGRHCAHDNACWPSIEEAVAEAIDWVLNG